MMIVPLNLRWERRVDFYASLAGRDGFLAHMELPMSNINASLKFSHPSLSPATQEKNWDALDKAAATHLQMALTDTLQDMGRGALRVYAGANAKSAPGGGGTLSIEFTLTEDGKPWAGPHSLNYPNIAASAVALFKGFLDGNVAAAPQEVRSRERKHGGGRR